MDTEVYDEATERIIGLRQDPPRVTFETSARPTPPQIEAGYRLDEALATPESRFIAIVDNVLTTGAHFRTASSVLAARFPAVQIVDLFIARRVPDADPAS